MLLVNCGITFQFLKQCCMYEKVKKKNYINSPHIIYTKYHEEYSQVNLALLEHSHSMLRVHFGNINLICYSMTNHKFTRNMKNVFCGQLIHCMWCIFS